MGLTTPQTATWMQRDVANLFLNGPTLRAARPWPGSAHAHCRVFAICRSAQHLPELHHWRRACLACVARSKLARFHQTPEPTYSPLKVFGLQHEVKPKGSGERRRHGHAGVGPPHWPCVRQCMDRTDQIDLPGLYFKVGRHCSFTSFAFGLPLYPSEAKSSARGTLSCPRMQGSGPSSQDQ